MTNTATRSNWNMAKNKDKGPPYTHKNSLDDLVIPVPSSMSLPMLNQQCRSNQQCVFNMKQKSK